MGRITSFSKQVIVFFLVLSLFIRPTFASSVGGWSMGNPVSQGASVVYEGTKNIVLNGADYVKKGTAKITPSAANVAKTLGKGVAGVALSVAVEQLLGTVDWVLDPANNAIKYTPKADSTKPPTDVTWYFTFTYNKSPVVYFKTEDEARSYIHSNAKIILGDQYSLRTDRDFGAYLCSSSTSCHSVGSQSATYTQGWVSSEKHLAYYNVYNPNVTPVEQDQEKSIPLNTVAQQVISNAESDTENRVAAQAVTTAAAADIVAEAEADQTGVKARPIAQQLETSAQTKPADEAVAAQANTATGTQTQNPAKPETTDLALEFPTFCGWAPVVCEAAQTVISFPITLTDWWNTGKTKAEEWATSISEAWTKVKEEYADEPEENTDTELDIPDLSDQEINSDISFGGSCPSPLSSEINFMGLNKTIELSFDPVCQIAEFIKPVVISISAFSAALIVAGIRTEDD